ncbi:unnamed protein product [Cyclocybe aegerita]|uniref:Uncharacterized protein n=1 Tax=Cyclocybe aegerita TaxID=1973307 RepID=A0A8S0WCI8_CYCAE|nr:unnamed protein product [Cyclocybe aegerita]
MSRGMWKFSWGYVFLFLASCESREQVDCVFEDSTHMPLEILATDYHPHVLANPVENITTNSPSSTPTITPPLKSSTFRRVILTADVICHSCHVPRDSFDA